MSRPRPAVSVVVPFNGDRAAARRALAHVRALELGAADEAIIADNTAAGRAGSGAVERAGATGDGGGAGALERVGATGAEGEAGAGRPPRVVAAPAERSSYHARNAGAAASRSEWILFCDADCAPRPDLLARYFEPPPGTRTGAVAGAIVDHPEHDSLLARYAASRGFYRGERGLQGPDGGYAPTGNLLVRRAAFERLGGFVEGIRSAGDVDLCWRLQAAGWTLERRPRAVVAHRHREDLASFLAMVARYGAGSSWLNRRYPGASPRWPLSATELARAGRDAIRGALGGEREEAAFRIVDALGLIAHNIGYAGSNRAARGGRTGTDASIGSA